MFSLSFHRWEHQAKGFGFAIGNSHAFGRHSSYRSNDEFLLSRTEWQAIATTNFNGANSVGYESTITECFPTFLEVLWTMLKLLIIVIGVLQTTRQSRKFQLDFLILMDHYPLEWIFKVEKFFTHHNTPDATRVDIIVMHFEKDVVSWFQMS